MAEHDERIIFLTRRVQSMEGVVKHFEKQWGDQAKHSQSIQEAIAQLTAQMQNLTTQVALLRAGAMGHGPTG